MMMLLTYQVQDSEKSTIVFCASLVHKLQQYMVYISSKLNIFLDMLCSYKQLLYLMSFSIWAIDSHILVVLSVSDYA